MNTAQPLFARAALFCSFGSAASAVFSIAAAQIFLGLALAALLLSGERLRLPPLKLPLALFIALTFTSLLFSENPLAGRPQIRKLFVLFLLLVVFSTFRRLKDVRRLVAAWACAGVLTALVGFVQFGWKVREAGLLNRNFYEFYVGERITGFMSHWMTFSGQLMIAGLLLAAFLMFSPHAGRRVKMLGCAALIVIGAAMVLGMTRNIWLATTVAGLYLIWCWNRRLLLAAPALAVLLVLLSPDSVRTRLISIYRPQGDLDSNQHRVVCWRTGWEMIKAHPWFGLGPEMVNLQFQQYVPADIPRPLPEGWYGHLHNVYIHYAAERGVPFLFVLLWLLGKIGWDFLRTLRRLPPGPGEERFILHGAVAVLISTLISGVFELNLGDSEVLMMFLTVVAGGYVAAGKGGELKHG